MALALEPTPLALDELPDVLTCEQVAAFSQLPVSTIWRECREGRIRHKRIGRSKDGPIRIRKAWMLEWLEAE